MIDAFLVGLNGRVDIVVGEVEQEWFLLVPFLKKTDGFLGQALGQVLAFLFRLESRVAPGRVVASRGRSAVVPADIEVESLVGRPMPFIPKVPLAGKESLVAVAFQFLGNGHFLMGKVVPVVRMDELVGFPVGLAGYPVGDVYPYRVATCHDARPRRGADRTGGVSVIEFHARLGQTVYVRGFVESRTISADVHHSHVVDEKE